MILFKTSEIFTRAIWSKNSKENPIHYAGKTRWKEGYYCP
jgi:hypothetical protein